MNPKLRKASVGVAAVLAALVAVVGIMAAPAAAQLDPGFHEVFQDGHLVGQIFVSDKIDRYNYVEHWVLFAGYVYPSATNRVDVRIVPSKRQPFASESEFFSQQFPEGSRYIRVVAEEFDTVPTNGTIN